MGGACVRGLAWRGCRSVEALSLLWSLLKLLQATELPDSFERE